MEISLALLSTFTISWSVVLGSITLQSQRNTFEPLSYSVKKFDCQDMVEDILNPSNSQQILYAGKQLPCLPPNLSSHSLSTDSVGYQYFLEITKQSGG